MNHAGWVETRISEFPPGVRERQLTLEIPALRGSLD